MIALDRKKLRLELVYLIRESRIWNHEGKLEVLIDQVENDILKLVRDANKGA